MLHAGKTLKGQSQKVQQAVLEVNEKFNFDLFFLNNLLHDLSIFPTEI